MKRGRVLAAAAAAAFALVPCMPLGGRLPSVDSGVFLYEGWRITHGELPYRDAWDSKPPLIYYLDAAGLAAGGGSEWGVWALQLLFMTAAILLSLELLEREFGVLPAALATGLWVACLPEVLEGGNVTEQYGLTLKLATLWLLGHPLTRRRAAALGALTGALFLLKQNLVAISGAWLLIALFKEPALLLPAGAGFAALVGGVLAAFAARGALGDLWSAAFSYNAVNFTPGFMPRWSSFLAGAAALWECGVPAALGWGLTAFAAARERGRRLSPLLSVCLLALPLELAASSATGRDYRHYDAAWLPVFAVFAAALFQRMAKSRGGRDAAVAEVILVALVPTSLWWSQVRAVAAMGVDPVVSLLERQTTPDAPVLVWGDGARYNFAARRVSPTRYVIAHPLLRRGYSSPAMAARFLSDLERRPPAAVVDLSGVDRDIPPLDGEQRARWAPDDYYAVPPELEQPLAWLQRRYAPAARLDGRVVWLPWRP